MRPARPPRPPPLAALATTIRHPISAAVSMYCDPGEASPAPPGRDKEDNLCSALVALALIGAILARAACGGTAAATATPRPFIFRGPPAATAY